MRLLPIFTLSSLLSLSCCVRVLSNTGNGQGDAFLSVKGTAGVSNLGSAVISSPLTGSQRLLPAIKVDPSGKVYTTQILKQQLANELGLPLRDLRIVDPSFPSQIQATFTARPKAILFCIENIKVVVQRGEALVFSPYQPEVQEFIPALQAQISAITGGSAAVAKAAAAAANTAASVSASADASIPGVGVLATAMASESAPFELIVLEAALNVAIQTLLRRLRALEPAVASALNGLRAESRGLDVVQTQVDELLPLKNKLDVLRKRVKEIKRAITEVLNNDEDLIMMQLGGAAAREAAAASGSTNVAGVPVAGSASPAAPIARTEPDFSDGTLGADDFSAKDCPVVPPPEPPSGGSSSSANTGLLNLEMMFENYLNEVEWISAELEEEVDEIRNTEENVVLQLDLLRNRILKMELQLSISSFVVTCGALVTGLFGMNLLNHFELHPAVFYAVTALLVASMSTGMVAFRRYAQREKLF